MNRAMLIQKSLDALMCDDIDIKISLVNELRSELSRSELDDAEVGDAIAIEVPGRPELPRLVHPADVPKRGFNSELKKLRLVHSIAHIEFNAINLALDAVYRFTDMPADYYRDWMQVAMEEAYHFSMLRDYLTSHGSYYGEYDAHNGLWEMAVRTDHDVQVRMALVPRVLEARGLDVTPSMIEKLRAVGDEELIAILEIIFRDEIGHVKIGSSWFGYCCTQRGHDPEERFMALLDEYIEHDLTGPFELTARREAGFTENELNRLTTGNR